MTKERRQRLCALSAALSSIRIASSAASACGASNRTEPRRQPNTPFIIFSPSPAVRTLSAASRLLSARPSVYFHAGVPNHLLPARDVGLDEFAELLRRSTLGGEAELLHPLLDVRHRTNLGEIRVDLADDGGRRAGRQV